MVKISPTCLNKLLQTISLTTKSGVKEIRIVELPMEKYDEYIDFKMNYYVKYELSHRVSGIPACKHAMNEYRGIIREIYKDTSMKKFYCLDDNSNIIGISSQKLIKLDDHEYKEIKAQTEPVKRFFEMIAPTWLNLFPVRELMKKYRISSFYDDMGMATHPLYQGLGFASKMTSLRREICKLNNVPMTGAWVTSPATRKAAERDGWEVVYEISYEELGRILGIKFENTLTTCVYMIARI